MASLHELLDAAIRREASDLHLVPGRAPVLRVDGRLESIGDEPLDSAATEELCRALCPEAERAELERGGTTDFAIAHGTGNRFRVSVLRQREGLSAVLRLIPSRLLGLNEIGLPAGSADVLRRRHGLVLVTGPTGSGKTTTLAAMVDWINANEDRHIVTLEDPIEYYHEHKQSIVTQREIGRDVADFPEAMRRVLRQDPDVILLGEMRDLQTIAAAITAAETGHLVLGTLHTTGSARTVDRIIDAFPANQQDQIRTQLSGSIAAVFSQVLVPRADGAGRVAAFEVMLRSSAISNLIRKNETNKIRSTIQTSRRQGMLTLEDALVELVERGTVSREAALTAADEPRELAERLG